MSLPPEAEDPIEEVASNWLTLRAEGLTSRQSREFEAWCRADPRHAASVARLEAACARLRRMPLIREELQPVVAFPVESRPASPVARTPSRRLLLGLAASLALAALAWWQWPRLRPSERTYATSDGGYERVMLADGSVVELNANSQVRVDLRPDRRRATVVRGEGHFTIAHDSARPFIVSARGVAVRAVGTAFNVRLVANAVEVMVTEGTVAVSDQDTPTPGAATVLVEANERTLVGTASPEQPLAFSSARSPTVERLSTEALREALSWQERRLVFSETPLRDVAAQFNRRNRLQIVLGDPVVAARPVGGTFATDNVEGFIRLLEGSGRVRVERRDAMTVVLHAVP